MKHLYVFLKKTKSVCFLFLYIISNYSFSQINTYKPFPQTYNRWEVTEVYIVMPGFSYTKWKRYQVAGDTVIGTYTYKKVNVAKNTGLPNSFPIVIPYGPDSFAFAYRNDVLNKRVYILDATSGNNKDTLWYDFNLNVGDTLKSCYSNYIVQNSTGVSDRHIVQSIDSVLICGVYHKQFNFGCPGYFNTELIEGYGFKDQFTSTLFSDCPFEPYVLFSTEVTTCISNTISDYSSSIGKLSVFPNPNNGQFTIQSKAKGDYTVVNEFGQVLQTFKTNAENNYLVNLKGLSNGIYFLKGKNGEQVVNEKIVIQNL
jgi:Secretion system C-terminal sorting domain